MIVDGSVLILTNTDPCPKELLVNVRKFCRYFWTRSEQLTHRVSGEIGLLSYATVHCRPIGAQSGELQQENDILLAENGGSLSVSDIPPVRRARIPDPRWDIMI
jgi:hypothetical protein